MTAQTPGKKDPILSAQLRDLQGQMWHLRNGELAAAIKREDKSYTQVLGVPQPALRALAQDYAPNQPLARELIQLTLRESLLMAQFLGDAMQFTHEDLSLWLPTFRHPEVRDAACAYLISASPLALQLARELVRQNEPSERIAGVLLLAHALRRGNLQAWRHLPKEDPTQIDYFEEHFLPLAQLLQLVDIDGLLQPVLFLARQLALQPSLQAVARALANSLVDLPNTVTFSSPHNLLYEELTLGLEESKTTP